MLVCEDDRDTRDSDHVYPPKHSAQRLVENIKPPTLLAKRSRGSVRYHVCERERIRNLDIKCCIFQDTNIY